MEKTKGLKPVEHMLDQSFNLTVTPETTYLVKDAETGAVPDGLVIKRIGDDLLIEVNGEKVASIEGFYGENIESVFSADGSFTPADAMYVSSSDVVGLGADTDIIWQAEAGGMPAAAGWALGLLAVGGAGVAVAGGSSDSSNSDAPAQTIAVADTTAPVFISGNTANSINENSGTMQQVYTAQATDVGNVSYSLKAGADADAMQINSASGVVSLKGDPNYEVQKDYLFTVVAIDEAGNSNEQTVGLVIDNVDDGSDVVRIVFDLLVGKVTGVGDYVASEFLAGEKYDIVIRVSTANPWLAGVPAWQGGANLGAGDKVTLVGNIPGQDIVGISGKYDHIDFPNGSIGDCSWETPGNRWVAQLDNEGYVTRRGSSGATGRATIWDGSAKMNDIIWDYAQTLPG
ncbi:MAG: cadherin repeat domain-containing protein [Desulfotalea sp.]